MWWARQDSNLQPDRYERPALTIELQALKASVSRYTMGAERNETAFQSIFRLLPPAQRVGNTRTRQESPTPMKTILASAALALAAALAFAAPAAAQMAQVPTLVQPTAPARSYVTSPTSPSSRSASPAAPPTAADALAANSTDLARVIDTIKGEGVAARDIGTSGFSIYPVYEQADDGATTEPPKIVGYQVTNEVRVTIRDIATSGGILDKVVGAGANQVNGITFDNSDRRDAGRRRAPADAVADAQGQAEIMAAAAGVRLVRIQSTSAPLLVGCGGPMFARLDMAAAPAPSAPVMPGQREVNANATVTWEIAPQ